MCLKNCSCYSQRIRMENDEFVGNRGEKNHDRNNYFDFNFDLYQAVKQHR